jgi:hypothetical protein
MYACTRALALPARGLWAALVPGGACTAAAVLVCLPVAGALPQGAAEVVACLVCGVLAALLVALALVPELRSLVVRGLRAHGAAALLARTRTGLSR